ncbi:uncharacterized protein LOC121637945 isoform X2 [Melanotaenia boesemani]|uniref:uncharacterized protein LOC121637945 isoform X2 n=1 Tax=Melanotaenia boesemani TaxID=1250792 RepID=UPI001C03BD5D|nr:uncharacterized protein LOC121637945 isoform X2 [Melanotaenia boesemani]
MERNKKTLFLFWVLLVQVCSMGNEDCPILPDKNLSCYNDYSNNITCLWNSTLKSNHMGTVCTIYAENIPQTKFGKKYNALCTLEPADASNVAIQKCSLIFRITYVFKSTDVLSLNLNCNHLKDSQIWSYKPWCHIKLNPPAKPNVNSTTVSWSNKVTKHIRIDEYESQLQWKQIDQSWGDPSVQRSIIQKECKLNCEAQLDSDLLVQGKKYEARVRVRVRVLENDSSLHGTWSEWSPTESWVSSVGRPKPQSETAVNILNMTAIGLALFGLLMIVVFLKTDKTTWIYIGKKITGSPLPNPGKAAILQTWLSPNFTYESLSFFFKPLEVIDTVDAVKPRRPDVKMGTENDNLESTNSSFSNPSYSDLCTPPVSSFSPGSLEPCTTDSPYGPVCVQGEGKHTQEYGDVVAEKKILDLIFKGNINSKSALVISDYERVEKLQLERLRLQSIDSGMCNHEEVSQESMEADSINVSDGHDEGTQEKVKEGQHASKLDFQNLFSSIEGISGKQFIQVCSDYEQAPKLQVESSELPSLESGVGSGGEEHESQEENMEENPTETTHLLFAPDSSNAVPCSHLFSGSGLKPDLHPPLSHGMFEKLALMSESRLTESYDDSYIPVRQEQK